MILLSTFKIITTATKSNVNPENIQKFLCPFFGCIDFVTAASWLNYHSSLSSENVGWSGVKQHFHTKMKIDR
jgi:hypothetical protein